MKANCNLQGVVVTFRNWRTVFWLLTAMNGFGSLLIIAFFPETIPYKASGELVGLSLPKKTKKVWNCISPIRVVVLCFKYANIFCVTASSRIRVYSHLQGYNLYKYK